MGLYFYEETYVGIERTKLLEEIWKSLKDREDAQGFEIVINHALTMNHSYAGNIPWYSISGSARKLRRILRVKVVDHDYVSPEADYLIIF